MPHRFIDALAQPPLERVMTAEGEPILIQEAEVGALYSLWPTHLMVCQVCYEVQLHSFNPRMATETTGGYIEIVNTGRSTGQCDVD